MTNLENQMDYASSQKKRNRLLVRKGIETIALKVDDIALFYTENKVVFAIDQDGKKYLYDKPLSELETELDTTHFFRVNRQYIVNINCIKSFRPYERVKIEVKLTLQNVVPSLIISQQTAPVFKKWIYEA
jgi:DNA-binding LytR/AlgR family response regulator